MTTSSLAVYRHRGPVVAWLIALISLVFCMVVVGGITRLTESGLSIVEWAPILGVIPPLNEADWQAAFAQYQHSPQYRLVNAGMSLSEFKTIFFWEYVHRLLGRGVGLVFLLPFLFFWLSGCFGSTLARRLLVALFLGGLQGLLGWFMVKSGLVDEPRVSHYRLAAHLGLAFLIMCYLLWVLLGILHEAAPVVRRHPLRGLLGLIAGVTLLQIVYGAFVAGLRAGGLFGTFPLMGDRWIGVGVMELSPWWLNLLESHATVQFVHRWLGTVLLALVVWLWVRARAGLCDRHQLRSVYLLAVAVIVQFFLGVFTLVNGVPLAAAVMHQGCASLVLLGVVYAWFSFSRNLSARVASRD